MDYFNGVTNDQFIKFFLDELYTKTEFVQHDIPDDFFDPEQEYGKHISKTQEKLYAYILEVLTISDKNIGSDIIIQALADKKEELFKSINPEIDIYISKIIVDYK